MARRAGKKRETIEPESDLPPAGHADVPRSIAIPLAIVLCAAFVAAVVAGIRRNSATYDEPVHIAAGYTAVRWGDYRLNPEHPPLAKKLFALPLLLRQRWPSSLESPSSADVSAGGRTLAALQSAWNATLADPGSEWRFAHDFFYGINDAALARAGVPEPMAVPGTEVLVRSEFLNDAHGMLIAARSTTLIFGVALALLILLWSRELFGWAGALVSLAVYAFEPSFIANSGLATNDVALAFFYSAACYCLWRVCTVFSWGMVAATALAIGLAFATKFSAAALVPVLLLVLAIRLFSSHAWTASGPFVPATGARPPARIVPVVAIGAAATVVTIVLIWASYGWRYDAARDTNTAAAEEARLGDLPRSLDRTPAHFPLEASLRIHSVNASFARSGDRQPDASEIDSLAATAPLDATSSFLRFASRKRLLPEAFLYGIAQTRERSVFRPAYLRGHYSDRGFPSYFAWTFLTKTTIPALLLMAGGLWLVVRGRAAKGARAFLLIPAGVYALFALGSSLTIGHRHLLPLYPFLIVIAGAVAIPWKQWSARTQAITAVVALVATALAANFVFAPPWRPAPMWSQHLAYFNEFAGGPERGSRIAVDSSLDWGQDLGRLKEWLDAQNVTGPINLCYFGTADPKYYGIPHRNLYLGYDFEPDDEFRAVPGLLAMSVTHRVGSQFDIETRALWHRFLEDSHAELVGRAGYGIEIYRISAPPDRHSEPAELRSSERGEETQNGLHSAGSPRPQS